MKNQYYDFETNVYGGRVFGRYNFTESAYTPYTNPIIRMGVMVGL